MFNTYAVRFNVMKNLKKMCNFFLKTRQSLRNKMVGYSMVGSIGRAGWLSLSYLINTVVSQTGTSTSGPLVLI